MLLLAVPNSYLHLIYSSKPWVESNIRAFLLQCFNKLKWLDYLQRVPSRGVCQVFSICGFGFAMCSLYFSWTFLFITSFISVTRFNTRLVFQISTYQRIHCFHNFFMYDLNPSWTDRWSPLYWIIVMIWILMHLAVCYGWMHYLLQEIV